MRKVFGCFILLPLSLGLWAAEGPRTIVVFPFENQSGRADLDWISESFAEILSSRLSGPNRYVLDRDERNAAYEQLGLFPANPLTLASEFKVAETLGVSWGILGKFTVKDDRLTAQAQVLDAQLPKLSPPLEVTGELVELVDLQSRLAWRLLATHDPAFVAGQEEEFRRQFREVRLDAFENFIRGILAEDGDSRIHFLSEADRLDPGDHQAAFELGRYYFGQKDYAKSGAWLGKVNEGDSHYLESQFLRSVDEFFLGHVEAAEKGFAGLAQRIPLNEVWNNLGVMYAHRGRYAEALASFERAYQGDPTDEDFCFNLAASFWYLKKYSDAEKTLEEALRVSPDDLEAHTLLAAALGKLGHKERQRGELDWLRERESSEEPRPDPVEEVQPQTRLKKNYDGRAFRLLSLAVGNLLEERLRGEPPAEHAKVHRTRGETFLEEKRLPEAEHELAEAVLLLPEDSESHLALGKVYEEQGRHREALAELESSLKIKDSVEAHLWLARIYLSQGQRQMALDQGGAAQELDPGNREAKRLIDAARAVVRRTRSEEKP